MKKPLRILGLETSGTVCGVAHLSLRKLPATYTEALRDGTCVMQEHASEFSRHAEIMYHLLNRVFRLAHSRLDRVHVIAVSLGPGSFTGLRVGLAVAKMFAKFGGVPLVGVPTLEAQAAQAALNGDSSRYLTTLDAKRGEVYAAMYRVTAKTLRRVKGPWVCDPVELAQQLDAGVRLASVLPRASTVAALGAMRFLRGHRDNPDRLVPLYVRRPAATEKLRKGLLKPQPR